MNCFRHYVVGAENRKVFFSLVGWWGVLGKGKGKEGRDAVYLRCFTRLRACKPKHGIQAFHRSPTVLLTLLILSMVACK